MKRFFFPWLVLIVGLLVIAFVVRQCRRGGGAVYQTVTVTQGKIPAYKVSQRIVRFDWPEVKQALQRYKFKPKNNISSKADRSD